MGPLPFPRHWPGGRGRQPRLPVAEPTGEGPESQPIPHRPAPRMRPRRPSPYRGSQTPIQSSVSAAPPRSRHTSPAWKRDRPSSAQGPDSGPEETRVPPATLASPACHTGGPGCRGRPPWPGSLALQRVQPGLGMSRRESPAECNWLPSASQEASRAGSHMTGTKGASDKHRVVCNFG